MFTYPAYPERIGDSQDVSCALFEVLQVPHNLNAMIWKFGF